jgi:sensor histidine kinase regulating citrate/malate metabolism
LLGNLLDNAVEVCKRLDDNIDKWITVKIESQKHLLFLVIENAVCEPPVKKNGTPISIKQDKMRHGYGLKSVEQIVNKHEGMIMYQSRDKAFQVKLLF